MASPIRCAKPNARTESIVNEVLHADAYAAVADGTEVAALLNATRGPAINGDLSLANGRLAPGTRSAVHFHPVVTQLTYVLTGTLTVWMQGKDNPEPYRLAADRGGTIVTQPGTLLQLGNETEAIATVLYVVTPGYLQDLDFDDAVIAGPSWDKLHTTQLDRETLRAFTRRRAAAKARLLDVG